MITHSLLILILATVLAVGNAINQDNETEYENEKTAPATVTLAGTGSHGTMDGLPAQFNLPGAVTGINGGGLIIIDTYNNLIRRLDEENRTTRAAGTALLPDASGFPRGEHRDGAALAARFNRPTGAAMDAKGRIFIADSQNHVIRIIVNDRVFTFAGGSEYGHADGTPAEARFHLPTALAFGPCGGLFITDTLNHVIRKIDFDGNVTTYAGIPGEYGHYDGGRDEALFYSPMGIVIADCGMIFIADTGNHMIRVIEDGVVRTLAGTLISPDHIEWGDYEDADFDDEPLGGFTDGEEALFNVPVGLALWGDYLLVADSVNHRIRAVLPCGYTLTLAGSGYTAHRDGLPQYASFHFPRGVFVRDNALFIADTGNNMIRVLPLTADMFVPEGDGEDENS